MVNDIEYLEVEPTTAEPLYFHSWVTDLTVNEQNAHEMDTARNIWPLTLPS